MNPLRVVFIGIDHPHGSGWRESLAQLTDEVEIVALVPAFSGGLTSLEERYAHLPRFETVPDAIRWGEFDGAVVCVPNNEAAEILCSLAKAGKHLLAEKPGAGSAAKFQPVVEAVTASKVAFQSGYLWRYDPGANRLREMMREGRFGKLISIEMVMVTSDLNRRGPGHYLFSKAISERGFFNWLGCHWLDLLPYVTEKEVTKTHSHLGNYGSVPSEVEDGGTIVFDLAGGGLVTFTGGYWLPRWVTESSWTIRGSERWLRWEPNHPNSGGRFVIHGPQPQFMAMEEVFTLPADTTPGYGGARMLHLIRDWVNAARGGEDRCRNHVQAASRLLLLLDEIYTAK